MAENRTSKATGAHLFKPGISGNPGGRPKANKQAREAARKLTVKAIKALEEALEAKRWIGGGKDGDPIEVADHATRVYAAQILLDRGHGKPVPETDIPDDDTPGDEAANLTDEQLAKLALEGEN